MDDTSFLDHCGDLPVREFAPGERILEEGSENTGCLFILKEGEVDITKNGASMRTVRQAGAILGEMSALLDGAPLATAVAVTPSQFYVVEDETAFLKQPEVALAIARVLASRLGVTDRLLAAARNESEGHTDPKKAETMLRNLESALVGGWE
jgi:CRP/FNR family cyclic AMP-dependent transcriptional regulator